MIPDADAIRDFYQESSLNGPDNAVGFVLWRVMHRYQRAIERALARHDLTHLQFTTLAMVGWMCRSGKPATQAELAREANIHPMQISLMLKALEAKSFVVRPPSETDTRTRLAVITTSGLTALQAAFPIVIDVQHRMFGKAGASGGSLLEALRKVERSELSDSLLT
jgi:DNA-binding MarR family transcriptional regulator